MQRTPRNASARPLIADAMRSKRLANIAIIVLSALLVAGLGLLWFQGEEAKAQNAASVSRYTPPAVGESDVEIVRFAAVGDSITEANSPDIVERRVGDTSWVAYAQSRSNRFAGGWADGGAQTSDMRENFEAVPNADVLVVLAGANDVSHDVPFDEIVGNISAIVDEAAAPRVLVSSIPPQDKDPDGVVEFNRQLEEYAKGKGWDWVDGSAGLRDGDRYADGMSEDGVHPTKKGAQVLGDALQNAISEN